MGQRAGDALSAGLPIPLPLLTPVALPYTPAGYHAYLFNHGGAPIRGRLTAIRISRHGCGPVLDGGNVDEFAGFGANRSSLVFLREIPERRLLSAPGTRNIPGFKIARMVHDPREHGFRYVGESPDGRYAIYQTTVPQRVVFSGTIQRFDMIEHRDGRPPAVGPEVWSRNFSYRCTPTPQLSRILAPSDYVMPPEVMAR